MSEQLDRLSLWLDGLMPADEQDTYRLSGQKHEDELAVVAELMAARERIAELEQWKRAIDEALVVSCIGTCDSFGGAKEALNALLAWESAVALDPAVSEPMRALTTRLAELERVNNHLRDNIKHRDRKLKNIRKAFREYMRSEIACMAERKAEYERAKSQCEIQRARDAYFKSMQVSADENQHLRSLLTDCMEFVERFGEINFTVDADSIRMHQKRLELLEKIKGLQ